MVQTKIHCLPLKISPGDAALQQNNFDETFLAVIDETAAALKAGKLAAFPTETVYGVGACMTHEKAVLEIYKIKGRPPEKPLSVLIASPADMEQMAVNVPKTAFLLAKHFWPGPMTLILEKNPAISDSVTAGKKTIGLRVPAHPVPLELVKIAGPLACPSANLSGDTDSKTAADVLAQLNGKIDILIDGGPTVLQTPSTIIDLTTTPPKILRKGSLSTDSVRNCIGEISE